MGMKTPLIVLKRIRAGDEDLLIKGYGRSGLINLFVKEGLLENNRFFGVFEPFNLVYLDFSQRGSLALPNDIMGVDRISYLCSDYERFLWMSWVAKFVIQHITYYDEKLFDLFRRYLLSDEYDHKETLRVKFKLDFLKVSGFEPKFLKERIPAGVVHIDLSKGSVARKGFRINSGVLKALKRINTGDTGKVRLARSSSKDAEELLDALIEYHIK